MGRKAGFKPEPPEFICGEDQAKDLSKRLKELMDLIWAEMTEGEKKEVERLKKNLVN